MATPWGVAKQIGSGFMDAAGLRMMTGDDYLRMVNKMFSTPEKLEQSARGAAVPQNIVEAFTPRSNTVSLTSALPKPQSNTLKSRPMAASHTNGVPAIPAQRTDQVSADSGSVNTETPTYGETPGSGYIYGGRDFQAKGSGPATGGFSRPSTADANLAFEDEQNRLVAEQTKQDQLRREYNDELQGQRNFDGNINWALNNPNAPGAAAFLAQLQQGRKIGQQVTPLSDRQSNLYKAQSEGFSKEAAGQNQLAEARTRQAALPYIGPKAEAETGLQNAQAGYYQTKNPTELGTSRSKDLLAGYLAKQKQSGKEPTLSEMIKLKELRMVDPQGYEELMQQITKG